MAIVGLMAVIPLCAIVPAAVAKKKAPAVTTTASVPIGPGAQQTTAANCPGKTHISCGGWSIAPPYTANGTDDLTNDSGTRITHLQSQPIGTRSWTVAAAAFTVPAVPGTLTAYARCESNSLGKLVGGGTQTSTIPIGLGNTTDVNCPVGTHVLTGGFAGSPAGNLASPSSSRLIIEESRRLDVDTWQFQAVNPTLATSVATLSMTVLCERNAKGRAVSEVSSVVPIPDNGRAAASPFCTGKTHAVGGGFSVPPIGNNIPVVGIDQMQPSGQKGWLVGLYEYPLKTLPPGSTLTAFTYCKKNA